MQTSCPACLTEDTRVFLGQDPHVCERFLQFSRLKYNGLMDDWLQTIVLRLRRCPACGHVWYEQRPAAEALGRMYDGASSLAKSGAAGSAQPSAEMVAEMRRLKALHDRLAGADGDRPRLLDYGAGAGKWARAAATAGFAVTAYEPSVVRGGHGNDGGVEYVNDLAALADRRFDAVNLEQVLEHVPAPTDELTRIRALMTGRGILRIRVPNIQRPPEGGRLWADWPFDGRKPHTMAPFEHLNGFTAASLASAVRAAGFAPLPARLLVGFYPTFTVRRTLGRWVPRLSSTMALAQPRG